VWERRVRAQTVSRARIDETVAKLNATIGATLPTDAFLTEGERVAEVTGMGDRP